MQTGAGTSVTWPVAWSRPVGRINPEGHDGIRVLVGRQEEACPVGSRLKLRGVSPCDDSCPTRVRRPVASLMAKMAILWCPRLEP